VSPSNTYSSSAHRWLSKKERTDESSTRLSFVRQQGGSFDFLFTSGPTPLAVIEQHYEIVGKPSLYPAWSFVSPVFDLFLTVGRKKELTWLLFLRRRQGFHLCRWGYDNVTQTREVVTKMREANIPLETMVRPPLPPLLVLPLTHSADSLPPPLFSGTISTSWFVSRTGSRTSLRETNATSSPFSSDLSSLPQDTYRNWIPAPGRFDPAEYTAFVEELHAANQHYIMIVSRQGKFCSSSFFR